MREEEASFLHLARVVRSRWWLIVICAVGLAGAAYAFSSTQADEFDSTAIVSYGDPGLDSPYLPDRDTADPEREAATAVTVSTSPQVLAIVRRRLNTNASDLTLREAIAVQAGENSRTLEFTAAGRTPANVARVANTFAEAFVEYRRQRDLDFVARQEQAVRERLRRAAPGTPLSEDLRTRLVDIAAAEAAAGDAELVGRAPVPTTRRSPTPKRDVALGLILGTVLGLLLAFALDTFDRRLRDPEEFEERFGVPAFATVPQRVIATSRFTGAGTTLEPYRVLRSALSVVERQEGARVVALTSALPGEGKTTVAVNLARAAALTGERVVLVECDMRRPSLVAELGLEDPGVGLTGALLGDHEPKDYLRLINPTLRNLAVLPAGELPANSAELLGSRRMGALLDRLERSGALIILDTAPLLPVADTHGLLGLEQVDGVILVARSRRTRPREIDRVRALLDRLDRKPMGLVVTGTRGAGARGYDYGYRDPGASNGGGGPSMSARRVMHRETTTAGSVEKK